MTSITGRLANAISDLHFEDLSTEVVAHAKRLIADTIMVAYAAAARSNNQMLSGVYRKMGGAAEATTWETASTRLPVINTAFVNALYASALDYDSLNGAVHADAVCLPAAWAIAEHRQCSGRELLCAFVAGSEITARLADARVGEQRGWSATSIYGGIGASVAAAKLMGLGRVGIQNALGMAAVQAAGTQQSNVERVLSKRIQPAFAARNGVTAALLAESGATAPASALEGRYGLRALYESGDDGAWVKDLWSRFLFSNTAIKCYPVCAGSHAALAACERLLGKHHPDISQIDSVTVTISPFMSRLVGAPFATTGDLEVTAQFSIQYALAVMLIQRRMRLDALDSHHVLDPEVRRLVDRIEILIDGHQSGEVTPAIVELRLRNGSRWSERCDEFPGGPDAPITEANRREKLLDCAAHANASMSPEAVTGFCARIDALDKVDNVGDFGVALLTVL